jgi:hypothetical protein
MGTIKIEIEKPSQEFEIASKVYTVSWDDQALDAYRNIMNKYQDLLLKAQEMDLAKLTPEEQETAKQEQLNAMESIIDTVFGAGSYAVIYEDVHKSMANIGEVLRVVFSFLGDKLQVKQQEARQKYTKK